MRFSTCARCVDLLHIRLDHPACSTATRMVSGSTDTSTSRFKHRLRTRDIALRVRTRDGMHRICFCSSSGLLAQTIHRHDLLSRTNRHERFLELLGTQLSWNNLLAAQLDHEERVEMRFTGDEATIVSEALALGECRCYVAAEHNASVLQSKKTISATATDSSAASAAAFALRVNRVLYHQGKPFSSRTAARLTELCACGVEQGSPLDCFVTATDRAEDKPPLSLAIPGMVVCRQHPVNETHTASRSRSGSHSSSVGDTHEQEEMTLECGGARAAAFASYFTNNMTLHAYNALRVSDGVVPVVALYTSVDAHKLQQVGPSTKEQVFQDGSSASQLGIHINVNDSGNTSIGEQQSTNDVTASTENDTRLHTSHACEDDYIQHSFGVLVTPLAAGAAAERKLWRLQRALALASALQYAPVTSTRMSVHCTSHTCHRNCHSSDNYSSHNGNDCFDVNVKSEWSEFDAGVQHAMADLLARAHCNAERPSSCQDILSLVTGDYEGAYAVAQAARQYVHDPAEVSSLIEPLRARLGVDDVRLELEQTDKPERIPLDFMCRCSRTGVMHTLAQNAQLAQPTEQQRRVLEQENFFRCTFCAKVHRLTPEEWAMVWSGRA